MMHKDRKNYEAPTLQELGVMKEITENGNQSSSDSIQGQDSTAYNVGS